MFVRLCQINGFETFFRQFYVCIKIVFPEFVIDTAEGKGTSREIPVPKNYTVSASGFWGNEMIIPVIGYMFEQTLAR